MAMTIKDLSQMTGISTSTISRALSGRGYVDEETRLRVEEAVKKSGYEYHPVSRQGNASDIVLLILGLFTSNVQYEGVQGIGSVFDASDVMYVVAYGDKFNAGKMETYMRWAIRSRFKGMIILSAVETPIFQRIVRKCPIPCVAMLRPVDTVNMDSVCMDNKTAGRMATEYLISKGHKRIVNLTVAGGSASNYRVKGYLEAMKRAGLPVMENDVMQIPDSEEDSMNAGSLIAVSKKDVTAIYTSNEMLAVGVINGLRRCGKRVPEDVSVIATDNTNIGEFNQLTTVYCDTYQMGAETAQLFLERCKDPFGDRKQIYLPPSIVERATVVPRIV